MIVGTLKRPIEDVDKLTMKQLSLLLSNHFDDRKDHYEMIAYAFRAGYTSAHSGKKVSLFEDANKQKRVTQKQREDELRALNEIFNN